MQPRRIGALAGAALLLTLAACGSPSDGTASVAADQQPPASDAPAGDDVSVGDSADDFSEGDSAEGDAAEVDATEDPATEPETVELATAPGEPDAADTPDVATPAEPVIGGRLFAVEVQPVSQFEANPFPDLVVEDIGKDAQVNTRNILPSDRPVLLWAWAPH